MFLDYLTRDFFAAVALLARRARGDYGPDKWAEQFPRSEESTDPNLTPWALFERWIAKAKPAASTIDRWRAVFRRLQSDFPNTSAAALLPEQMQAWANGLIRADRTAQTVANVWVSAARTVFAWAVDEKLISRNPFVGWRVKVPQKIRTRETKALIDDEIKTILSAALAVEVRNKADAANRWCPWLAAYSGARMGELTQLRGIDIIERDGIHAMKISPEAGTTKTRKARTVPLHEHLIEQGFLAFVRANGGGPLFYNEAKQPAPAGDPTNPRKARYVKARERLATWVGAWGSMILSCHRTTPGGIHSKLLASAAACPKRCSMPSSDMRLRRSAVATASPRLQTRLMSFSDLHGISGRNKSSWAVTVAVEIT